MNCSSPKNAILCSFSNKETLKYVKLFGKDLFQLSQILVGSLFSLTIDIINLATHDTLPISGQKRGIREKEEREKENEKLMAEIKEYQSAEARMKAQIEQQRDELCELGEKLDALYAQRKSKS